MKIIDKQIKLYENALLACKEGKGQGLLVGDNVNWLKNRLKQFKREKRRSLKGKQVSWKKQVS